MDRIAEEMLSELEDSIKDLLNFGKHDGECTNAAQVRNIAKVDACAKHETALKARKERVELALMQFKTLRNLFGLGVNNEQRTL